MNRWPSIPDDLPMQWKAEHRMLSNWIQELEQRKAELERMIEVFKPERVG